MSEILKSRPFEVDFIVRRDKKYDKSDSNKCREKKRAS